MNGFSRKKNLRAAVFGLAVGMLAVSLSWADVRLPDVFCDHMVLQRNMKIPVWGTAGSGERVTVAVAGVKVSTKAGADGHWTVQLPALKAGGPFEMVISGKNRITLADIMVGEVWLCSGQSNMWWPVGKLDPIPENEKPADDPGLRLYSVWSPENDAFGEKPAWTPCTVGDLREFTAVGYYFGRMLRRELGVAVGLIHSSMGGSLPESWMKRATLEKDPRFRPIVEFWDSLAAAHPDSRKLFDRWLGDLAKAKLSGSELPADPPIPFLSKPYRYYMRHPQICRDAQLAPLVPYGIRGVIWFQGESSTSRSWQYRTLFPAMIHEWRADWNRNDLPFYYVQIANMAGGAVNPERPSSRMEIREAQLMALSVPNTGMAVTIDIGDPKNVHFNNKWEVGRRLALIALARDYGRKAEYSGPVFKSSARDGSTMRLRFDHAEGLAASGGGALEGFVVAGSDHVFRKAGARIEGDAVVVSSPDVKEPAAVRYAWDDDPKANLVNRAGLPASPFRTDSWPGLTDGVTRPLPWEL